MPLPGWEIASPVTIGCAVLMWAGLEKARDRRPLASTLAGLGASPGLAGIVSLAVPAAELGTVAVVVAGGLRYLSGWVFIALGVGFAAAGALSKLTDRQVACACFGSTATVLGWRQLAALPLWMITGLAAMRLPGYTIRDRLAVLATGLVAITVLRAVPAIRGGLAARADRRGLAGG